MSRFFSRFFSQRNYPKKSTILTIPIYYLLLTILFSFKLFSIQSTLTVTNCIINSIQFQFSSLRRNPVFLLQHCFVLLSSFQYIALPLSELFLTDIPQFLFYFYRPVYSQKQDLATPFYRPVCLFLSDIEWQSGSFSTSPVTTQLAGKL